MHAFVLAAFVCVCVWVGVVGRGAFMTTNKQTTRTATTCAPRVYIRWSNEIISFGALRGSPDELSRLSSSTADSGVKRKGGGY